MKRSRIIIASAATLPLLLTACELTPKRSTQAGYRGTGMEQVVNPAVVAKQAVIPANAYDTPDDSGPRAGATYKNLQVLGGVSTDRFNHLMANINNWVVPQTGLAPEQQGCNYCHNPNNMASDEKYTKVVARRMIQMTQAINTNWSSHVQQTGVTCWTCHRGNAVPVNHFTIASKAAGPQSVLGNKRGQNTPDANVGYAALPYDPFDHYLRGAADAPGGGPASIRVASNSAYPSPDHVVSVKQTEETYGLMMHISKSLGVNCTYCHNTQSFRAWNLSRAQRATAYYGIRMVGNINDGYLHTLTDVFPANRKGPEGDVFKVNCLTCHQGLSKPLGGVSMLAEAPALRRVTTANAGRAEASPAAVSNAMAKPGSAQGGTQ